MPISDIDVFSTDHIGSSGEKRWWHCKGSLSLLDMAVATSDQYRAVAG